MKFYKITDRNGKACFGGDFQFSLPQDGKPGDWTPSTLPVPCMRGWHVWNALGLRSDIWADAGLRIGFGKPWNESLRVWEVEVAGPALCGPPSKYVATRIRLVKEIFELPDDATMQEAAKSLRDSALEIRHAQYTCFSSSPNNQPDFLGMWFEALRRACEFVESKLVTA